MSSHNETADLSGDLFILARAVTACSVCAVMLLSSLVMTSGGASSDPVVIDNADDTNSVVWDFDDTDSYDLTDVELSGGDALLQYLNQSDGDHEASDYSAGTMDNVDLATVPGSVTVDVENPGLAFESQPGPEGVDSYISETKVNDNYDGADSLFLDSETSKRLHIVMWFDLSSMPTDAVVADATLWLYQIPGSKGSEVTFDAYSLSSPFVESEVTWARNSSSTTWVSPGGDYDWYSYGTFAVTSDVGWLGIDIPKLVELWATETIDNNGIILVPEADGGDNVKVFQSSDDSDSPETNPRLVVNYTVPGDTALLESRVLGPGSNTTFTLTSFSTSTVSHLDDSFPGTALSPKWTWVNDPSLEGGEYDVGVTRPGWLHVTGEANTQLQDTTVTANYLHQDVTGDFVATTYVEDYFTVNSMGAGLLLYESAGEWMYIGKMDPGASGRIQVVVCENGTSAAMGSLVWTGYSNAHLKVERNSTGVWFYASTDGSSYQLAHHHVPAFQMRERLDLGLFIFSNSATRPVVDFDHFTVTPPADSHTAEVRARVGNSTSFSDASWEDWASADVLSGPAVIAETGKYLQYMVYMSTDGDWYTPAFSGFDCWYEMYAQSGIVGTEDYVPTDFSMWYTMTTVETRGAGVVKYWYSTDHGNSWIYAGTGGSYSITSTEPSLKIRMTLETYDTLTSPRIHSVSAMHGTAISYLYVVAPETVVAGEAFPVTVYARDASDATMVHWSGPITLTAMDTDAVTPMDTELAITSATVTSGGYVTVPNELYTEAGAIIIKATAQEAYGFSAPITIVTGPIYALSITPAVDVVIAETEQIYHAEARDVFDNIITDAVFTWSLDEAVGTLNTYSGSTVVLEAGEAGSTGYLVVSADGLNASLPITITHAANAPMFTEDIPDQTKYEDSGSWTVDLSPYVQDLVHEDDELRWYVTNENVVDVSGENRTGNMIMTFSTVQDQAGTDELDLYVLDPDNIYSVTNLTVEIVPVNDWPSIDQISPLVVHYDILYVYNMKYYVSDVDNSEYELSLSVDAQSAAYVSVERLLLYMLYPEELNGTTQTVVVTVSDGEAGTSTVIQVTVSDDNVPVMVDLLPDFEMYQGETVTDVLDLDDYFFDSDGDVLYFAYGFNHILVTIDEDHMISLVAPTDWYGTEYVIFSAIDPDGARVESATTVVVHRVNQAPVVEDVPDLVVKHDLPYEFDLTRYVSDPDNDLDDLYITTDDPHVVPAGTVLNIEYPESMMGLIATVVITVSDGELSDSCYISVTVGNNAPPVVGTLPSHWFQEDLPTPYPSMDDLDAYFQDEEGEALSFEVFTLSADVSAETVDGGLGGWTVAFTTGDNWYGSAWFVVRATDPEGALIEAMAELTVQSVPDAPVLKFNETVEVSTGVQRVVDLDGAASDPDVHAQGLEFSVASEYSEYATIIEGVLVLEFPDGFLSDAEDHRHLDISVTVTDPDELHDTDTLAVMVVKRVDSGSDSWLMLGMGVMAAIASGSLIVAMRLRKRPFVIKDIMVVHNDGFLIGRAAEKTEGEIDEDVLSGMLTAVLNFVEDSMAKTQDGLRSFGFDRYKVLVKRGKMTYMAVVYDGDEPETMGDRLGEFLVKVEKIYRKRIENWTGDMDTDFAGIHVLLQAFVKENSRRGSGLNGPVKGAEKKAGKADAGKEKK